MLPILLFLSIRLDIRKSQVLEVKEWKLLYLLKDYAFIHEKDIFVKMQEFNNSPTQSNKIMENLMKVIILDKSNEIIESIARLMLRPLGSNIEFGEPTVRCNPHIQRWARWSLTLRKVS